MIVSSRLATHTWSQVFLIWDRHDKEVPLWPCYSIDSFWNFQWIDEWTIVKLWVFESENERFGKREHDKNSYSDLLFGVHFNESGCQCST